MKTNFFVEIDGNKLDSNEFVLKAKDEWKEEGKLVKNIKNLNLYFNINENKCYYVINDEFNGCIDI